MSNFWSADVHDLKPYVPGEQPVMDGLIKLNTNENPYPPSPAVLAAIRSATNDDLRLYPDPECRELKKAIAAVHGLSTECVFTGNGSDEVLAHVFRALLKHRLPILFPDISYSFYPVYCGLFEIAYRLIPLDNQYRITIVDYVRPNGGIVIANPNAPTGIALKRSEIRTLLELNPDSVVVVDEAYIDFGGETCVPLIHEFPNLLVVHTLSKSGSLAGLRVGFAMGHSSLIDALERIKGSFNSYPLDKLAIAGSIAAINDQAYFASNCKKVVTNRNRLITAMVDLYFEVLPSCANFIFTRHASMDALKLQTELRNRKILVRHFNLVRIDQFLRISIGTDEQCRALIDALAEILASQMQ